MNDILSIRSDIVYEDTISRIEIHPHQPYVSSTFDNSDTIIIPIQQQDIYTLPCESTIYIEGKISKLNGDDVVINDTSITNNGIAFLFDEIRYSLNGVEIDKNKFVGMSSTMKAYASLTPTESEMYENAGWGLNKKIIDNHGRFNVCLPLKLLLGFCEDYKRIIVNVKQELTLIRARNDENSYTSSESLKIHISKLTWFVPHVYVNDKGRLKLLKVVEANRPIQIPYRSWDLHEYPLLPKSNKVTWIVKTATQLEKPRFVVVGFQQNRKNMKDKNISQFDHCNLTNIKLYLNSICYPYNNLNLNFSNNCYALLYDMYTNFQKFYYDRENDPLLSKENFKNVAPLIVIECINQNESIKPAAVDIRLEFEADNNFPENTAAYCLILHDKITEYNPLTGSVKILT